MANYERGVYEPSDEVRVFDGSEEEEDVEGSRLPLMIVLVLLVLAMFGGMIWVAYSQGVARGRGETPVLTAANGPEKVAPSQPGGANVPYQGFKIYEQPAPPDDSGDAPAANAAPPAPKPAPVAAAPVEAPKPAPQAIVAAPPPPKPAPVAAAPAPKPTPVAVMPKPAPPALKPTVAAAPAPKSAAAAPAPKTMDALIRQAENLPATKTAPAPAAAPASGAPRQLGAPVPATPTPKPVAAAPAASGSAVLQIGAYKSQADADTAWKAYKAKHPAAASYSEDVARVDLGAKGTWYRLRMAGFADRDAATTACTKLKADGGDCMLAK